MDFPIKHGGSFQFVMLNYQAGYVLLLMLFLCFQVLDVPKVGTPKSQRSASFFCKWCSLCWVKPGWKGSNWWPIHVVESMLPTMLSHLILWFPRISGKPSLDSYIVISIYINIYMKFPSKLEIERLWSVYPLWFQPSLARCTSWTSTDSWEGSTWIHRLFCLATEH